MAPHQRTGRLNQRTKIHQWVGMRTKLSATKTLAKALSAVMPSRHDSRPMWASRRSMALLALGKELSFWATLTYLSTVSWFHDLALSFFDLGKGVCHEALETNPRVAAMSASAFINPDKAPLQQFGTAGQDLQEDCTSPWPTCQWSCGQSLLVEDVWTCRSKSQLQFLPEPDRNSLSIWIQKALQGFIVTSIQ